MFCSCLCVFSRTERAAAGAVLSDDYSQPNPRSAHRRRSLHNDCVPSIEDHAASDRGGALADYFPIGTKALHQRSNPAFDFTALNRKHSWLLLEESNFGGLTVAVGAHSPKSVCLGGDILQPPGVLVRCTRAEARVRLHQPSIVGIR